MKFKKYNSIENSYRNKYIEYIKEYKFDECLWCVKEKIHGSNQNYSKDASYFRVGKKSCWISPDDDFNGNLRYKKELETNINRLYEHLKKELKVGAIELVIYGESFGGYYNHPKVEKVKTAKKIQHGISYHPDNKFLAFDMVVNGDFVNNRDFDMYCKLFEIPFIPTLFEGSFEDCLNYDPNFQSTIYKLYDLPQIENNLAEGVVIKPVKPKYFNNGGRVMLKNKNEKFQEIIKDKNNKKKNTEVTTKDFSEDFVKLFTEIQNYTNKNRLNCVLSKYGEITDKDFGKILNDFIDDIMDEFKKDFDLEVIATERTMFNKKLRKIAGSFIRKDWLNIIDNIGD